MKGAKNPIELIVISVEIQKNKHTKSMLPKKNRQELRLCGVSPFLFRFLLSANVEFEFSTSRTNINRPFSPCAREWILCVFFYYFCRPAEPTVTIIWNSQFELCGWTLECDGGFFWKQFIGTIDHFSFSFCLCLCLSLSLFAARSHINSNEYV